MKGMHCVLAIGWLIAMVASATAQNQTPVAHRPGIQSGNRFLGFVPKHEKILRQRSVSIDPVHDKPTSNLERLTRAPRVKKFPGLQQEAVTQPDVTQPDVTQQGVQQASYIEPGIGGSYGNVIENNSCACPTPCNGMMCKMPPIWGGAEYLHWWTSGADMPSLATTSPDDTVQTDAGVLPGATTLFGGEEFHDAASGGRFTMGMWLTPDRTVGIEAWYTFIGEQTETFGATQDDFVILTRPFFNIDLDEEDSRLIAFPDLVSGNLDIRSSTEFDTFEILLRRALSRSYGARSDLLFGYRRASLDDLIRFDETTTSLAGATIDTQFDLFDQFATDNEFRGAEIGIEYEGPAISCWSLGLLGKFAAGYNRSAVDIDGQRTTTTEPGTPTEATSTTTGGLLSQTSNIGRVTDNEFSTLYELGISMNRRWGGLELSIGYTFMNWSEVARAANQIDRSVNPTQIPPGTLSGEARPESRFLRDDFSAHGISAGIEYRF